MGKRRRVFKGAFYLKIIIYLKQSYSNKFKFNLMKNIFILDIIRNAFFFCSNSKKINATVAP